MSTETNSKRKKRRICRKITKERLDEYLALVGCKTRFCGAGTWRIVNAYGITTIFRFSWREENAGQPLYDLRLDGWGANDPFGKDVTKDIPRYGSAGFGNFLLEGCQLEAYSNDNGETWEFVSISAGKERNKKEKSKEGYAYIAFQSRFEPKN